MMTYQPRPQHTRTSIDTVSVRSPKGRVTLGDLRALLVKAEDLPDDAVVTVAGLTGNLLETHKYVEDIAVTSQRRETPVGNDSVDCA